MRCPSSVNTPKLSLHASVHSIKSLLGSTILKIGAVVNNVFNFLKLSSHFWFQSNFFPLFLQRNYRICNSWKSFNESSIITGNPHEWLDVSYIFWYWPFLDCLYLFGVDRNSFFSHHMTQILDFIFKEVTFTKFCKKLMFS